MCTFTLKWKAHILYKIQIKKNNTLFQNRLGVHNRLTGQFDLTVNDHVFPSP